MTGDFPAGIFLHRGFPRWVLFLPGWKPAGHLAGMLLSYRRSFVDSLSRFYLHCVKDFISFFNSTYPVENIRSNWTKLIRGPSKLEQSGFFFILKFAHRNSNKKEKVSLDENRKHSVFLSHLYVVLPHEVCFYIMK